jgi:hypothetical protein
MNFFVFFSKICFNSTILLKILKIKAVGGRVFFHSELCATGVLCYTNSRIFPRYIFAYKPPNPLADFRG